MREKTKLEECRKIIEECGFTTRFTLEEEDFEGIKELLEHISNPYQILKAFNNWGDIYIQKPEVVFDFSKTENKLLEQVRTILHSIDIISIDEIDGEITASIDFYKLHGGEYSENDVATIWDNKTRALELLIPGFSISSKFVPKEQLNHHINSSLYSVLHNYFKRSRVAEKLDELLNSERN